jgi:AraC family L-rhamnose operon transcriptional activator RhaR/AraC family L-rhamnose operon regulatory protein RhaS
MKKEDPPVRTEAYTEWLADTSLPISVNYDDPQPAVSLHHHAFDELVIVLSGTAMHTIDDQTYPVKAGDVFVVKRGSIHSYQEPNGFALANVMFDAKKLNMDHWDIRALPGYHVLFSLEPAFRDRHQFRSRLTVQGTKFTRISEWVEELAAVAADKAPGYRVEAQGLFMLLVIMLSKCYSDTPKTNTDTTDLLRIGNAISYIESNYPEKISNDQLARLAHMSVRTFQRTFAQSMRMTPSEYITQVRVRNAAHLLKESDLSLTRIALECGFSDSSYFGRIFRSKMGTTPSEYRKSTATPFA